MQEVINFLRQIEIGPHATSILEFLDTADPLFLGLLVAVFVCLGYRMVGSNQPLRSWGLRIGLAAFLAHGAYAVYESGGFDQTQIGDIAIRAGIVGGAVLAVIWVVLPIFVFAYRHVRLALAAFMIYFGYEVISIGEWPVEDLAAVSLRSAMAAGLAVTVAWILQPISDALIAKLLHGEMPTKKPKSNEQRQARRLRRLRRQYEQLLEAKSATTAEAEPDDDKGELMSRLQIEMRRRRDKARMSVELTYVLAMPDIGSHFPREMFEGWVNRYLGDHLSPEEVEENSQQLQKLISQYAHRDNDASQIPTLEELNHWLIDEKKRIQTLDIGDEQKQTKLIELQEHYISLAHRIMRDSHPAVVSLPANRTVPFQDAQMM